MNIIDYVGTDGVCRARGYSDYTKKCERMITVDVPILGPEFHTLGISFPG